ncbi:MAG: DUF2244 domain-containing protein [Cohaesibacter sp.]|nr:DUF2244 domain-containing protein [Cohaesibacter sp.]
MPHPSAQSDPAIQSGPPACSDQLIKEGRVFFHASLHPHRSLSRKGFIVLIAFIAIIMAVVSAYFWSLGAWPIIGFAGLDVLAIWWAFRANYRDGRILEKILLTRDVFRLARYDAKGRERCYDFNPYWAKLETVSEKEEGMTRLSLRSHGREIEIGSFLNAPDRESLADALQKALLQAKSPPLTAD